MNKGGPTTYEPSEKEKRILDRRRAEHFAEEERQVLDAITNKRNQCVKFIHDAYIKEDKPLPTNIDCVVRLQTKRVYLDDSVYSEAAIHRLSSQGRLEHVNVKQTTWNARAYDEHVVNNYETTWKAHAYDERAVSGYEMTLKKL